MHVACKNLGGKDPSAIITVCVDEHADECNQKGDCYLGRLEYMADRRSDDAHRLSVIDTQEWIV